MKTRIPTTWSRMMLMSSSSVSKMKGSQHHVLSALSSTITTATTTTRSDCNNNNNQWYSSWMKFGTGATAAVLAGATAVGTITLCEQQQEQHQEPMMMQQQHQHQQQRKTSNNTNNHKAATNYRRFVSKSGLRDPMTSYAIRAREREKKEKQQQVQQQEGRMNNVCYNDDDDDDDDDEEEIIRDPMTSYARRAMERQWKEEHQQQQIQQQQQQIQQQQKEEEEPVKIQQQQQQLLLLDHQQQQKKQQQQYYNTQYQHQNNNTTTQHHQQQQQQQQQVVAYSVRQNEPSNNNHGMNHRNNNRSQEEVQSQQPQKHHHHHHHHHHHRYNNPNLPLELELYEEMHDKLQRRKSIGVRDPMTSYAIRAAEQERKEQQQEEEEEANNNNAIQLILTEQKNTNGRQQQIKKEKKEEDSSSSSSRTNDQQQQEKSVSSNTLQRTSLTSPPPVFIQATSSSSSSSSSSTSSDMNHEENGNGGGVDMTPAPYNRHDTMTQSEAKIEEATRKAKQHSGGLKVFSGNGNMSLALEICRHLGVNLGKATVGKFADGEVNVVINENVRGKDVYIVQPTGPPVNDNIMELLLMVSTLRRSSARRITVVIPYYGYARQDRKMQARVPISAADVARLMEAMGIDRVIAVDLHCGQIQGFFGPRVPVDNLDGGIVGLDYFGCKDLHNPVIVSPDAGGVYRAKNFKEGLETKYEMHDLSLAMIVKQRAKAGIVDSMDLVGDVRDCDCIIVDDMIDTAGTLVKAADVLLANGARRVFAFASHGLLSGPGNDRIANSQLEEVVILNTLPTSPQREANEKLTELSVAPLLAQAIFNIHAKKSISALFK